jgi:hypothetical protein
MTPHTTRLKTPLIKVTPTKVKSTRTKRLNSNAEHKFLKGACSNTTNSSSKKVRVGMSAGTKSTTPSKARGMRDRPTSSSFPKGGAAPSTNKQVKQQMMKLQQELGKAQKEAKKFKEQKLLLTKKCRNLQQKVKTRDNKIQRMTTDSTFSLIKVKRQAKKLQAKCRHHNLQNKYLLQWLEEMKSQLEQ